MVKCDITKRRICEIMECDEVFGKSSRQNVHLPKMSPLLLLVVDIHTVGLLINVLISQ